MKKTIFLLIALISSACSPQVTEPPTATLTPLPTQTSIPMPTLHPEFIELQNTINAEDGFVLTHDGTIEYNGVEVPDIKVTADGNYVLVVGEEMILLEPDEVTLDPEKGVVPDGYELNENGEWVEAEPPAMSMVVDVLTQYNLDPETYTIVEGEDGKVQVVDNETEAILMESDGEQIKYGLAFASDVIAKASCEPTPYRPTRTGLLPAELSQDFAENYAKPLLIEFGYWGPKFNGMESVFFSPNIGKQCWEVVTIFENETNLFFRDTNKVPHKLPLIPMSQIEVFDFLVNN